jgi:hypothetical protein
MAVEANHTYSNHAFLYQKASKTPISSYSVGWTTFCGGHRKRQSRSLYLWLSLITSGFPVQREMRAFALDIPFGAQRAFTSNAMRETNGP